MIINVSGLKKSFIYNTLFENVNFVIEEKDKIGLIGMNGSGKSTLMKILQGQLDYDEGNIYKEKNLRIGYLEQEINIDSSLTVFDEAFTVFDELIEIENRLRALEKDMAKYHDDENRYNSLAKDYSELTEKFADLNGYGLESRVIGVLKGLGFLENDFQKKCSEISGGQKARLSLAKLLLRDYDLLLLDEPTNHLDIDAITWLERYLQDFQGAIVVISHDRYFLDVVTKKIFLLENKKLEVYNSGYSDFIIQRKKDLEIRRRQYENQQKEIELQEKIIQRFLNMGRDRLIKQGQSRQKLLDKMKRVENVQNKKTADIKFNVNVKSGNDVLICEDISMSFDEHEIFKDVDINIYKGEKVALIGKNGVGKTSLFKIILGDLKAKTGEIKLGSNVNIGYFAQELEDLDPNKTILDEIWDSYPDLDYYTIRSYLAKFMFYQDDVLKEIGKLSGGERARISLLKLMLSESNFLMMDEPTNHLDIDSKEVLEDALLDYDGTLFIISHDRFFLNKIANKILELERDGVKLYHGNYDYYLKKKAQLNMVYDEENRPTRTEIKLERKREREQIRKRQSLRKQSEKLEREIHELETEIERIDNQLYEPEIASDYEKALELSNTKEEYEKKLLKLYDLWLQLTEN
ncbi:MAG: ABC-F family ATP-binding cassette domain-containing protein [Tissierellia bacterium]|nr:ABC-F family ATP-binding cassette domain-containing protein [Tissierellia bacterium]